MFQLLTRVLLWLIIAGIAWYIFLRFIPQKIYTWLGGVVMVLLLVVAFLEPSQREIGTLMTILTIPLKPLGLSLILLGSGLRDYYKKERAVYSTQIVVAFFILLFCSIPIISYALMQQVEQEVVQLTKDASGTAPVLVVLGRGATEAGVPPRPTVQLTEAGDRVLYAARLYRDQINFPPLVVVSAGPREDLQGKDDAINEGNDIRNFLIAQGVAEQDILLESASRDIRSSVVEVKKKLEEAKADPRIKTPREIMLVSSAINIRRATMAFRQEGFRVIPKPTHFMTIQAGATPSKRIQLTDLLPSAQALDTTTRFLDEYLVSIFYFLRGWLSPAI